MVVCAYNPSVQGEGGEGSGAQGHSQMCSKFVVSVEIRKEVERKGRWGEEGGRERKGFPVAALPADRKCQHYIELIGHIYES